jgi:hypothetical protein
MMKHSTIRSFHASHRLEPMTDGAERSNLPWMSESLFIHSFIATSAIVGLLLTVSSQCPR